MDSFLDILANLVIQRYFLSSRCLLIFIDHGNNFSYSGSLPIVTMQVQLDNIHSDVFLHYFGCQGIVMKTNNPVVHFKSFEREIKLARDRFNTRKFLVLPGDNLEENLEDIFSTEEIMHVADLDIIDEIIDIHEPNFSIWTHPYPGMNLEKKFLLDKWFPKNRTFLYGSNLYPDKLKNQMGRKLRMATFPYEPYSVIGKCSIV